VAETRRVVLATGEVREASVEPAVAYGYMAPLSEVRGHRATRIGEGTVHAPSEAMGDTAEDAVTRLASHNGWAVREILAPGEPTRAELAARLAAVTAERDVLRAQQAPLLDAHDALVAAARAAGWTGAGATGAELVAWVRRGAMTAAGIADDHGRTGVASAIRLAAIDLTGGE